MKQSIAVVIPCYNVASKVKMVVDGLPEIIDYIVLVDDKSHDDTLIVLRQMAESNDKVVIVEHESNQGVGGAMISGFKAALALKVDIVLKMDGDNQMDPAYIPKLLAPIQNKQFHVTKGNRFYDIRKLSSMPVLRRIGNLGMSFLIKSSSGYWNILDPTNGYVAIKAETLSLLNLDKLDKRFFFESSLVNELYFTGALIKDVSIPARYSDESSNLSLFDCLLKFPPKLMKASIKRIIKRYFIYDFSIYTIYLLFGLPLLLFGMVFGGLKWAHYASIDVPAPTGTVMIAVLSIVIGFQLLLSFIQYDMTSKLPYAGND